MPPRLDDTDESLATWKKTNVLKILWERCAGQDQSLLED